MSTDLEFQKDADAFMEAVFHFVSEFDPDEVDSDLAMGVLTLEFADGTKCIMNRQTAAHQIWLAHGVTAWHFEKDPESGRWLDTKGRGSLPEVLSNVLSRQLGRPIRISLES